MFEEFDDCMPFPLLVGTHCFPGMNKGWHEKFDMTHFDKRFLYCTWFRTIEKIIGRGIVDVLAHPGRMIMQNGIIEEFDSSVLKDFEILFSAALEHDVAIEINESMLGRFPTKKLEESYLDLLRLPNNKF